VSSGGTVPGAAGRALTDFEQVLLAVIASEPRSGYGLKKMFNASPASVYQPSPGALYPALRRLEERGLLRAEQQVSSGRRAVRLYQVTDAGLAVYLEWLRRPVVPETVAAELGQHLMRFSLMETYLERAEVIAFLADLGSALDGFVTGVERFAASRQATLGQHALLALEHGIATHRASLEWVRSAMAALGETSDAALAAQDGGLAALSSGGDRIRPGRWRITGITATGGQAMRGGSNDEAGHRLAAVGGGGRGLGP
jgi:DNA-binding PadR family transcriptional regulator